MEQAAAGDKVVVHIGRAEGGAAAGAFQEDAVGAGRGDDEPVGRAGGTGAAQAQRGAAPVQQAQQQVAEVVLADEAHQGDTRPERGHGQPGVGHDAPGRDVQRPDLDQLPRPQQLRQRHGRRVGESRGQVHTGIAGDDGVQFAIAHTGITSTPRIAHRSASAAVLSPYEMM